jgi:hypothetical protein
LEGAHPVSDDAGEKIQMKLINTVTKYAAKLDPNYEATVVLPLKFWSHISSSVLQINLVIATLFFLISY